MSIALLQDDQLPAFNAFSYDDFEPALSQLIDEYNAALAQIVAQENPTFETAIAPLSNIAGRIDYVWSLLSHLKSVKDSEAVRVVYKRLSPLLSRFQTEIAQNKELFAVYKRIEVEEPDLDVAQRKVLENALRGFYLNGVALEDTKKNEFKALSEQLVGLKNTFSEHVLDSTEAWSMHLETDERLRGVPQSIIEQLAQRAQSQGFEGGYLLGLDLTLYLPVMQYCSDRDLRALLHQAFITRASNQGPHKTEHANEQVMLDIMGARKRSSELLGLPSYADISVAAKMAESPKHVLEFLEELLKKAKPLAVREMMQLRTFAAQEYGYDSVEAWDVAFVSEALRKARFDLDQEQLREYFPLPTVLDGLFEIVHRLFGVQVRELDDVQLPEPSTRCFEIVRESTPVAYIYMDLYAREGKRGGAWVGPCKKLTASNGGAPVLPVAFLVCNFSSPQGERPSLLTHTEMVTLFHEFGHALHHCLTKISYPEVSGISGVPWDAVELPSQFLENWCWQPEALAFLSKHIDTGASLPEELIERMVSAKSYLVAMQTVRQLEFATFDFRLHHDFEVGVTDIQSCLEEVQEQISVVPIPEYARFANAFSHIFAGGYAAGYYSYKWAEVLSADAFSAFEDEGVFNEETGARFRTEILERGGAGDINQMFVAFRGRMPSSDALIKQMGV